MIPLWRGTVSAAALFAAAFVLHIVGGALDQDWLFAMAVVLIAASAAGQPLLAWVLSGRPRPATATGLLPATAIGLAFVLGTLWAAHDRSWAAWHPFVGVAIAGAGAVATRRLSQAPAQRGQGRV